MRPFVPDDLPPAALEGEAFSDLIGQAALGLGRFDGVLSAILNPSVLLSPFTNREAMLSSRIEGTVATVAEVLEHEAGQAYTDEKARDIYEIINYRRALLTGASYVRERPISLQLIRELHALLMTGVRGGDQTPGHFRKEQNWIGRKGCPIEQARFVPPAPMIMNDHLSLLQDFMASTHMNALVQLAIVHAQFEIIHPFKDGNGRLGRMLMPLFLTQRGILQQPVFYISEYFERNDTAYRDGLLNITARNDWKAWVTFFLNGIIEQAQLNFDRARALIELHQELKARFVDVTHSQFAGASLDAFFQKPVLNSTEFQQLSQIRQRTTSNNILKSLLQAEEITLLKPQRGRTPAIYTLRRLVDICDGVKPRR